MLDAYVLYYYMYHVHSVLKNDVIFFVLNFKLIIFYALNRIYFCFQMDFVFEFLVVEVVTNCLRY